MIRLTERCAVDRRDQTIVVNGIRHKAGTRIIRLLLLLDERRNSLCLRKTLIAAIWGGKSINGEVYLNQAIARLRPELRAVIALRFFSGLTLAETARALDLPPGTVSTRQRRALELLRLELSDEEVSK